MILIRINNIHRYSKNKDFFSSYNFQKLLLKLKYSIIEIVNGINKNSEKVLDDSSESGNKI